MRRLGELGVGTLLAGSAVLCSCGIDFGRPSAEGIRVRNETEMAVVVEASYAGGDMERLGALRPHEELDLEPDDISRVVDSSGGVAFADRLVARTAAGTENSPWMSPFDLWVKRRRHGLWRVSSPTRPG